MKTLLTVCSTLACAGGAYVVYEHPEQLRQTAQHWEAWRRSAATAPETPVAASLQQVQDRVATSANGLRDQVAQLEQDPLGGKPLKEWFQELSGMPAEKSLADVTAESAGSTVSQARDSLVAAAEALAARAAETGQSAAQAVEARKAAPVDDLEAAEPPVALLQPVVVAPKTQSIEPQVSSSKPLIARVVSERPVEAVKLKSKTLGTGRLRTMVIAGLSGEDRHAAGWMAGLSQGLEQQAAVLSEQTILVVPTANPAGMQAGKRFNARNVDLNRNFPGRGYRPQAEFSGAFPASEAETQQLLRLIFEFQPQRIFVVVEDRLETRLQYNRAAAELAARLHRDQQLETERLDLSRLPGSLEEFADGTLELPVVVVCLESTAPASLLTAIVAAADKTPLSETSPAPRDGPEPDEVEPTGPVAGTKSPTVVTPTSGRGYEELPPPP